MLEKRLKKNLYILIFLNLSLLLFAVAYTVYFKLSEGSDYAIECVFKKPSASTARAAEQQELFIIC